ncbi:MAG: sulfatase [Polyangiaceae bacterium]
MTEAEIPSPARPHAHGVLRTLLRPSLLGALYLGLLSLAALVATLADDRVKGVSVPGVRRLIATQFRGEVVSAAWLAIATAIALGLALGTLAGLAVSLRDRLAGRGARSASERALPALGVMVLTHGLFYFHDVARHPQAYAPGWYASGGVRSLLQVFVCDWLGPSGVVLLGGLAVVAYFGLPFARALRDSRASVVRVSGIGAVLGAILWFAPSVPSGLESTAHAAGERMNVVVVAADSLRADRVNARTAPEMTALAERGTRFDRTYVSLPRTFPSWVSMLSGKDPHHHGIRHMFPRREARSVDVGTIPARFRKAGYHTAVVSDFAGDIFRRYDFGFERTLTPTFDVRELVRETILGGQSPILPLLRTRVARRALPTLRELHDTTDARALSADALDEIDRASGKPFFVVAFYSTTHFPYSAPAPHHARFVDKSYRGPFRYGKSPAIFAEGALGPEDVKAVRGLYDGAVYAVDEAVGELVAGLTRRGLRDKTLIVVTSDHGECLYEPGRGQGHGDHLFGDEAAHVPLVVVDPRKPGGKRVEQLTRSVDLAPTLCELAGVACETDGLDGRSLAPALTGAALPERLAFAETGIWFTRKIPDVPPELRLPYPDLTEVVEVDGARSGDLVAKRDFEPLLVTAKHRMVRDGRYKLVYAPTRTGVRWMLFDSLKDPEETEDVALREPAVTERLKKELWTWMQADPTMQREGDMLVPRDSRAQ